MIPDGLDRKPAQLGDASSQTSEQLVRDAIADRVRLVEHVNRVIRASTVRDHGQWPAAPTGVRLTFQTTLTIELDRMTLSASRAPPFERKNLSTSMDTSIHWTANTGGQSQHASAVSVDRLAQQWQSIVGAKSAETSRPVGVVENQLIIEIIPDSRLNGAEMARAVAALGRDDIDRVAVRVVNALPDRQAQTQAQRQGIRR